jgi:cobalt-zinc-cadmium efflux system protein
VRGAFVHMMADAVVSAGVVVAGALIIWTGWRWLDPVVSLAIVVVIVIGTWSLLGDSVRMSLDAVPRTVELEAVAAFLRGHPGVAEVHDLHVWSLSTTDTALTAHLVMPAGAPGDGFLDSVASELKHRFSIGHATLQLESGRCEHGCEGAAAH